MTPDLQDLTDSTFYLMYNLHIPPTEVDNLSTYEMREYVRLLRERLKSEHESDSSLFKSLTSVLGLKRKSKS